MGKKYSSYRINKKIQMILPIDEDVKWINEQSSPDPPTVLNHRTTDY
jgi:hypothetical protein